MLDALGLPAVAAAVLLWYLACALRQLRIEHPPAPRFVWREADDTGWSGWTDLRALAPDADPATVLAAVRQAAHAGVAAVQFASVVRPSDAPDYTLRVLNTSAVFEPTHDGAVVAAH